MGLEKPKKGKKWQQTSSKLLPTVLWKKDYAWVPCMCSWAKNQENSTDCSEKKKIFCKHLDAGSYDSKGKLATR